MPWRCAEQSGDTLIKGGRGQGTVILLNSGETGGVLSWESLRGDISHTQVRYFLDEGERISRKKSRVVQEYRGDEGEAGGVVNSVITNHLSKAPDTVFLKCSTTGLPSLGRGPPHPHLH